MTTYRQKVKKIINPTNDWGSVNVLGNPIKALIIYDEQGVVDQLVQLHEEEMGKITNNKEAPEQRYNRELSPVCCPICHPVLNVWDMAEERWKRIEENHKSNH